MSSILVVTCLLTTIGLYFYNNPLSHGRWFMMRRFINWFPLGMTYAFLYMGRYNLNVCKNALGSLMTKEDFGLIFSAGTVTYGFASCSTARSSTGSAARRGSSSRRSARRWRTS